MLHKGFDVLVIGEGLAGVLASAAAARQGARVALVSKGPGSFMLADDCIDFAALAPGALDSEDGFKREIQFFLDTAAAAGCEYRGGPGETISVPTILGGFRDVTLAPVYFGGCDPRQLKAVAVVGFPSILDFDANFVAERLSGMARNEASGPTYTAHQLEIAGLSEPPRLEIQFAARFDRDANFRAAVLAALASVAKSMDLLMVPGVLGLNTGTAELRDMWRQVGCPICEIATLPPSVLGIRLFRRFRQYLSRMGVEEFTGFAVAKVWFRDEHHCAIEVETPGRALQLEAAALVLATGAFSHLIDTSTSANVPSNVFVCGGALNISEPRNENAIALVTGIRAGIRAAKLGAGPCGKMTGDWTNVSTAPTAMPLAR